MRPAICLAFALPAAGAAQDPAPEGAVVRHLSVMGTRLEVEVHGATRAEARDASERAFQALARAESRLSTWTEESELARFNRTPLGTAFALSPELSRELSVAGRWWRETDGAFDPGVGALVEAWGLRRGGRRPGAEELEVALSKSGFERFHVEDRSGVRRSEARIEEGGFGKGAGLDAALTVLREAEAQRAILDLGGQVAVLGCEDGVRFPLAHPRERETAVLEILIDSGSLATSASSERGFEIDGERYSHILDPRSGKPARDFGSLTVWAGDATTADCLSTGLYVLGPEQALAWAGKRTAVEVLVLETTAAGVRVRATAGFARRLTPTAENVSVQILAGKQDKQ